jgi:phage protein D
MPLRTPFLSVTLEGQDITPWVSGVSVTEDDKQSDSLCVTIPDPRMLYSDALFEGSVAEVDLGYAEANQHAMMIRATITKVEQTYPEGGIPTVTLKGEDKSIALGLVEKRKVWRDQSISAIVNAVASPYGFSRIDVQLTPEPTITKPIHQDGKTDLAFLQELADRYHARCFVELDENNHEVLFFISERHIVRLRRPERLVLTYRGGPSSNMLNFSPRFDSSYIDRLKQVSDVDKHGQTISTTAHEPEDVVVWELDRARLAQASSEDRDRIQQLYQVGAQRKRDLQQQLTHSHPTVGLVSPDQADLESTNDSLESRRLGMTASGSTYGNIWLRAKSNVEIDGANERFNGVWYVNSVTHKLDSGGYKTDFRCLR